MIALLRPLRIGNWWDAKIPPLLAVAYLELLRAGATPEAALPPLAFYLAAVVCVASYGHVVNDIFDIEADRRAGKANTMAALPVFLHSALPAALLGAGFAAALLGRFPPIALALLAANYLWPTLYSWPATRLKEHGLWGVVADAFGSHLTPTLLALALLAPAWPRDGASAAFAVLAVLWACALGFKGILHHQMLDRDADRIAGVDTFATAAGPGPIERFMPRYNLLFELPVSAALAAAAFPWCPLAAAAFALHCALETLKFRLGFRFQLGPQASTNRANIPFANEFFYCVWLPLAACLQLALADPAWLWLPPLHALAFVRIVAAQARDGRAVAAAIARS